jgi:hypothetical protein
MQYHTPSNPPIECSPLVADNTPVLSACVQGSKMISWVQEIAGWAPIANAWLVTAAVGTAIYFFPIARLLDSLAE